MQPTQSRSSSLSNCLQADDSTPSNHESPQSSLPLLTKVQSVSEMMQTGSGEIPSEGASAAQTFKKKIKDGVLAGGFILQKTGEETLEKVKTKVTECQSKVKALTEQAPLFPKQISLQCIPAPSVLCYEPSVESTVKWEDESDEEGEWDSEFAKLKKLTPPP